MNLRSILGNADLKPETTTEIEVGFESNFFSKRVNLDVLFITKKQMIYYMIELSLLQQDLEHKQLIY